MRGLRELARLLQPAGGRLFATQTEVGIVSGLPPLQVGRKVTIYAPARTASQQGVAQTALGACVPASLAAAAVSWGPGLLLRGTAARGLGCSVSAATLAHRPHRHPPAPHPHTAAFPLCCCPRRRRPRLED